MPSPDLSALPLRHSRDELLAHALRRGTRLRRRRMTLRVNAVVAVLGMLALGLSALGGTGPTAVTTVDQVEEREARVGQGTTTSVLDATTTTSPAMPVPAAVESLPRSRPSAERRAADDQSRRTGSDEPFDEDAARDRDPFTGHAECIVSAGPGIGNNGNNTHTRTDGRCRFEARGPSGYRATGTDWTMTFVRDGRVVTLDGKDAPACAPVGSFQRRDVVEIHVTGPGTVAVGERHGC